MEEFKGESLFDRIIRHGHINELDSATITASLGSIICYLHKNNIIMRNIRPEYFIFEEPDSFEFKLIDLSLSICIEDYVDNDPDELFTRFKTFSSLF